MPAQEIQLLLIIYACSLALNIFIGALLTWKHPDSLHGRLLLYWVCFVVTYVAQGFSADLGPRMIALSSISVVLPFAASVWLLEGVYDVRVPRRFIAGSFVLGGSFFVGFWILELGFTATTIPVALGTSAPVFYAIGLALTRRERLSTADSLLLLAFGAIAVHELDYPFLRLDPEFALTGFTIAFVLFLAISYLAPAVLHERLTSSQLERERSLRSQLETAQDRLIQQQKYEALGVLSSGIAHDFNNILTVVLGHCERLAKRADKSLVPELETIQNAALRAADIVRQIKTFTDPGVADVQPRNAADLSRQAIAFLKESVPANISLELEIEDGIVLECGAGHIHQLIVNLVTNSTQALNHKPGSIRVSLATTRIEPGTAEQLGIDSGDWGCLAVTDDGPGMDADTRSRATDPFFTTKAQGDGSGLGLAIVQGIARGLGGAVWLESSPDQGTTVSVYMPLAQGSTATSPSIAVRRGHERIIVIDDEPDIAALYTTVLTGEGYTVESFNYGEDARDSIFASPDQPDLVLTDLKMPGLDGLQLARELRTRFPTIKLMLITGQDDLGPDAAADASAIFDRMVEKPVPLDDLLTIIRSTLDGNNKRVPA